MHMVGMKPEQNLQSANECSSLVPMVSALRSDCLRGEDALMSLWSWGKVVKEVHLYDSMTDPETPVHL